VVVTVVVVTVDEVVEVGVLVVVDVKIAVVETVEGAGVVVLVDKIQTRLVHVPSLPFM
jgi:hypothetical protein